MNDAMSIGLDTHRATISVAVLEFSSKRLLEAILEIKVETVLEFIHGLGDHGRALREAHYDF